MRVRDGRRTPFSLVTHVTLEALHAEFVGPERSSAMSLYLALAARVSKERGRGSVDEVIEGTKGEIGEEAGLSAKTVELLTKRFVKIGILALEHRPGKASLWLLIEPGDVVVDDNGEPINQAPAQPLRDLETTDPRSHYATPAQPLRDTRAATARVLVKARTGSAGRREEKEIERDARAPSSIVSPGGEQICVLLEQHVLELDPAAVVNAGSEAWRSEADALLEGRTVDQVVDVIAWIRRDPFWSGRVLSPQHLRKHLPQIVAIQSGSKAIGNRDRTARERREQREEEQQASAGACCLEPDSPPLAAEDEWRALAPEVRASIGNDQFDLWLSAAHAHSGGDGELLLGVPRVAMGWVRDRFGPVFTKVAGRKIDVVYCDRGCS